MTTRTIAACALAGLIGLSSACQPEDGERTGDFDPEAAQERRAQLSPDVAAALDSGNEAYRAGRYEEARSHYGDAIEVDSTATAAWFGMYMSERALGNDEAARQALEHTGSLSEEDAEVHDPAPPDGDSG